MNYPERLYLFVVIPPEQLVMRIQEERVKFAETYGFVKGLRPPVHLSLTDILTVPVSNLASFEEQISIVQNWADCQSPMTIKLQNFNFFDNREKPVLYIDVIKNEPLAILQKELIQELKRFPLVKTKTISFTPHFTIGYRDIPKEKFLEIKVAYQKRTFHGDFNCTAIHLWKHESGRWQMVRQFDLKGFKKKEEQLELF